MIISGQRYIKGTPIQSRASILYNNLLKENQKNGKLKTLPTIKNGEKIKYIYLKVPNHIKENVIGWPAGFDMPKEFDLHQYIDWETQWEKTYFNVIDKIAKICNYNVDINSQLSIELF